MSCQHERREWRKTDKRCMLGDIEELFCGDCGAPILWTEEDVALLKARAAEFEAAFGPLFSDTPQ